MSDSALGRAFLAPIVLVAAAACASNTPRTLVVPVRDGTYSFREQSSESGFFFEGTFVVLGDTVTIDAIPGPCVYDTRVLAGGPITYQCGDVTVGFDRRNPVNRASYSYKGVARSSERVCDQSTTDAQGRQVCGRSHMEIKETPQMHYGRLSPLRVADAPGRP